MSPHQHSFPFNTDITIKDVIEMLKRYHHKPELENTSAESGFNKVDIMRMLEEVEALALQHKGDENLYDQALWSCFSKWSDQKKLSLFHTRMNQKNPSVFDKCLELWWTNKY